MGRADGSLGQAELKALSLSEKLSRKDCRKPGDKKGGGLGNVHGQTWPGRPGLGKWEGGEKERCQKALKEKLLRMGRCAHKQLPMAGVEGAPRV